MLKTFRPAQALRRTGTGVNFGFVADSRARVTADGAGSKFTVIEWFKCPDNNASTGHDFAELNIERDTTGEVEFGFTLKFTGAVNAFYRPRGFGNPSVSITSGTGYDDDQWHWVAYVKRADNDHELYVDGVSQGTNATSMTLASNSRLDAGVGGQNSDGTQTVPVGSCLGPYITFRRALSLPEIQEAALGRFKDAHQALAFFDGGVFRDISGHSFHARRMNDGAGTVTDTGGISPASGPPAVRFELRRPSVWPAPSTALAGAAVAQALAAGALTTGIPLAGAAATVTTAAGVLTTQIPLAGAAVVQATATGDLTVQIRLVGAAVAEVFAAGNMSTAIQLAGAAVAQATAAGDLTVPKPLEGAALVTALAAGALTTEIKMAGAAIAQALAAGDLTTAVQLAGAAVAQATAAGDLTTAIQLQGVVTAVATATGDLSVGGNSSLAGAAAAVALAQGSLTTQITLSGAALSQALAAGALSTGISLAGAALAQASAAADLTTDIPISGSAAAVSTLTGALTTQIPLAGASASASTATGGLTIGVTFQGAALVQALTQGALTTSITLSGASLAQAFAEGTLTDLPGERVIATLIGLTFQPTSLTGQRYVIATLLGAAPAAQPALQAAVPASRPTLIGVTFQPATIIGVK